MCALLQDMRFGWRMLTKHALFTLDAILCLRIGIGANCALFSAVLLLGRDGAASI